MTRQQILGFADCVIVVVLLLAGSCFQADELRAPGNDDSLDEFTFSDDELSVPVSVGDKECSFILDTGCTCSIFDTSLSRFLGRPLRRRRMGTWGDTVSVSEFAIPAMQVGRLRPPADARVVCINFREMRQAMDAPLDGLLGMDFLRGHIIQLDFDNGRLRFLKSVPDEAGERFEIVFGSGRYQNIPQFRISLGAVEAAFLIDTGFNGTMSVNAQLFDELDKAGRIGLRGNVMASTAGGTFSNVSGRLDRLTVGPFTHHNLVVDRHAGDPLFGLAYLKRFLVTFDFPRNAMYLKPGKSFDRPDEWDLSGLHIWRVDGEAFVDRVDSGSPAESLGVKPKDVIVQVNGQPAADVPLNRLRAMLRGAGRVVTLTVQRGELTTSVELKPREFRMGNALKKAPESAEFQVNR